MSCVIVRFCAANDIISAVVRSGTYGYEYSHVEIVLPDGSAIGAHASNGVAILAKGQTSPNTSHRRSVVIPCSVEQEAACMAFLKAQLGRGYDFLAIAAIAASFFVGPRNWRSPHRWFCSELACAALEQCDLIGSLLCDVTRVTPRDLALILSAKHDVVWLPVEYLSPE